VQPDSGASGGTKQLEATIAESGFKQW
jgi:hypothetical protein